mmetsp:Transcript_266/g.538  ORF Transcript_266/g.538 Transcript_266/m.538 type:complete len:506 (-) Transcript_266:373-1890(-)
MKWLMIDSARLSVAFLVVLDLTVGSQGGGASHAVQTSPQLLRASGRERQSSPALHYSRGCTLCAGGHTHTRLALRGGGDSLTDIPEEENVEGKDMGGWSRLREESIQDQSILEDSVRDFDDSQGSSVLDWTDGAADQGGTDPVTLPFVTPRERLTANQNNFSVWMKDFLNENPDYDLPEDPPFKGVEWVEALEKTFDRMQDEWEREQMDGVTAQPDGPYHPRSGGFHHNSALDLTTSGCMDRSWDSARLSHYARLKAESGNCTKWQERADEDDAEEEEEADTPITSAKVDGQSRIKGTGQKFVPEYSAYRNYGDEDWQGQNVSMSTGMDANTDPWFKVNQDTNTSQNPFEGDWVDKNLEDHFQRQLAKFSLICREQYQQQKNESYAGRMGSTAEEDDHLIYDCIDHAASVSYKNRQTSCPYANNKWVNNIGSTPNLEWNPETPLEKVSLWSSMPPSFNAFKGQPKLGGIDGLPNDGADAAGWRNVGGDHLITVQPEPEMEYDEDG